MSLTTVLLLGCDSLFAQIEGGVKISLANGSILTAKSAKIEGNSLRIETTSGGEMWLEKSDLSPQARHAFFGEPLPEPPKPKQEIPKEPTPKTDTGPALVWKLSDLPNKDTPLPQKLPDTMDALHDWIVLYLVREKVGETISVKTIPRLRENAMDCKREYQAEAAKKPKDFKGFYRLIGQHLLLADHFLQKRDIEQKRLGLAAAVHAAQCASERLKDNLLAVAICDAYIVKNLDCADERHYVTLGKPNLIDVMIAIYAKTGDATGLTQAYKLRLENAQELENQNRLDFTRVKFAEFLEKQGKIQEAIDLIEKIEDPHIVAIKKQTLAKLKKKLEAEKKSKGDNE